MKTINGGSERRPILFIAIGRQRVGKTTVLNTIAQFVGVHGGRFALWNADRHNRSYNLAMFHRDVLVPPSGDFEEVKAWLEERMQDQVLHGYDVMLDIGGGETPLSRLMEELPIVQELEQQGVRVVVAHVVGAEKADLDYLEHFSGHQLVAPEATLIVLNAGLVMSGRSTASAFAAIREHGVVRAALNDGAQMAVMPLLTCMSQVTDRGLTFPEAADKKSVVKPGHGPLSFFDRGRTSIWWEQAVPGFIGTIPPLWLPEMTVSAEQALPEPGRARRGGKANGHDGAEEGAHA